MCQYFSRSSGYRMTCRQLFINNSKGQIMKLPPQDDQRITKEAGSFVRSLRVADYSPAGLAVFSYIEGARTEYFHRREEPYGSPLSAKTFLALIFNAEGSGADFFYAVDGCQNLRRNA